MYHYLQIDPSRTNLPRDPVTGKVRAGPGRPKGGSAGIINQLAKGKIREAFEGLGGVQGMYEWAMRSEKNKYAFYVYVFPRLLAAEAADAVAERLAHQRPVISRIENVIIDPKEDY